MPLEEHKCSREGGLAGPLLLVSPLRPASSEQETRQLVYGAHPGTRRWSGLDLCVATWE